MSQFSTPAAELSIVVVDDARFNTELLRRALHDAGFPDVRTAVSADAALELLAERRADIVLVDWLMPGMDGLGLTGRIRAEDRASGHYTYVILLTAQEAKPQSVADAFAHGVDDFITKSPDQRELTARLRAAARIAAAHGNLAAANHRLLALTRELSERDGFDIATGLGSRSYVTERLDAMIRHLEGRGGVGLCGAVRLQEPERIEAAHGTEAVEEALNAVAGRLARTVRPLDMLGRLDRYSFGLLIMHQDDEPPHRNSFRRIHEAINLCAYRTSRGYLDVTAAVAFTAFQPPWDERPDADALIEATLARLEDAAAAAQVVLDDYPG